MHSIVNHIFFLTNPHASNAMIGNKKIRKIQNAFQLKPNSPCHSALKKEMKAGFRFRAKNTSQVINILSFYQVIPSEDFVMRNQPKENMHLRGHLDFPHCMHKNRSNTPEINNGLQGADTIQAFRFKFPN